MSALSTAAILGLAAATAGTQVAGSLIQNHAANNALDAQTAATNKAQALQQQQYQQAQQNTQPYTQMGQQALATLGSMQPNTNTFNPQKYSGGAPVNPSSSQEMPQQRMMPNSGMVGGPGSMAGVLGGQASGSGMQPNEPMVTLEAPDGTRRQFPQSQAQMYVAKGAKVVQ